MRILENIRKVSEKSPSLFKDSAPPSLSGDTTAGPGSSPAPFPRAIPLRKRETAREAAAKLRCLEIPNEPQQPQTSASRPQMWDINQGQECRHTLSRAGRPFPWFPATIALEGSGFGGDLFQKEKDAALTPLLQNPGWGSHRQAGGGAPSACAAP